MFFSGLPDPMPATVHAPPPVATILPGKIYGLPVPARLRPTHHGTGELVAWLWSPPTVNCIPPTPASR